LDDFHKRQQVLPPEEVLGEGVGIVAATCWGALEDVAETLGASTPEGGGLLGREKPFEQFLVSGELGLFGLFGLSRGKGAASSLRH
jgi:hypothetical protein